MGNDKSPESHLLSPSRRFTVTSLNSAFQNVTISNLVHCLKQPIPHYQCEITLEHERHVNSVEEVGMEFT